MTSSSDKSSRTSDLRLLVHVRRETFFVNKPHDWSELSPDEKLEWVYEAAEEFEKIRVGYEEVPNV
jgi:hypothetical protein